MDIIISHKSALEYWRLPRNGEIDDAARSRRKGVPSGVPGIADLHSVMPSGLSYPVNLMVNNQNAKWNSKIARRRVYAGRVPDQCFVRIGDGVSVSSPEFCFFQMAEELPLVKLIELGCELCGTYSLPANDEDRNKLNSASSQEHDGHDAMTLYPGMDFGSVRKRAGGPGKKAETAPRGFRNRPALTSTKALKAFTSHMEGVKGRKKAARALRYIAGGSASPRETILFMLLTLPYKLGGYGLPMPAFNRQINLGKMQKKSRGKAYYKCDLFWAEAEFAVEYDSTMHHTGADRIADDAKKRQDLDELGIHVITVTSKQIGSVLDFESVAKHIAGKLGKQLRYKEPVFTKNRNELRGLLL